jgi:hypothetical protein
MAKINEAWASSEDSNEEFEKILVQELFEQMMKESSSSPKRPRTGGSRPGRSYGGMFIERERLVILGLFCKGLHV